MRLFLFIQNPASSMKMRRRVIQLCPTNIQIKPISQAKCRNSFINFIIHVSNNNNYNYCISEFTTVKHTQGSAHCGGQYLIAKHNLIGSIIIAFNNYDILVYIHPANALSNPSCNLFLLVEDLHSTCTLQLYNI